MVVGLGVEWIHSRAQCFGHTYSDLQDSRDIVILVSAAPDLGDCVINEHSR